MAEHVGLEKTLGGSEVGGGSKTASDPSAAGCVENEEAHPPGSRSSGSIWVTSRSSVGAESLDDASGASLQEPISQGVFRQSAWPSHTTACGYLAIAK
jgi:hypothetical protein